MKAGWMVSKKHWEYDDEHYYSDGSLDPDYVATVYDARDAAVAVARSLNQLQPFLGDDDQGDGKPQWVVVQVSIA